MRPKVPVRLHLMREPFLEDIVDAKKEGVGYRAKTTPVFT